MRGQSGQSRRFDGRDEHRAAEVAEPEHRTLRTGEDKILRALTDNQRSQLVDEEARNRNGP